MEENKKESIPQLFGRNVRKYRKERGLTQEQLSEKLEISQKHLSIIETGTQFASASLIGRISEVLKVSPGDLFGGSRDDVLKEIRAARDEIVNLFLNEINRNAAVLDSDLEEIKRLFLTGKNSNPNDPFGVNAGW
ncbi:MAG: helix-turn-helix transcriptional regulator [Treponema sp.]|nr:helix-turn-helix transcriptional regulator [Treponema sp.]